MVSWLQVRQAVAHRLTMHVTRKPPVGVGIHSSAKEAVMGCWYFVAGTYSGVLALTVPSTLKKFTEGRPFSADKRPP